MWWQATWMTELFIYLLTDRLFHSTDCQLLVHVNFRMNVNGCYLLFWVSLHYIQISNSMLFNMNPFIYYRLKLMYSQNYVIKRCTFVQFHFENSWSSNTRIKQWQYFGPILSDRNNTWKSINLTETYWTTKQSWNWGLSLRIDTRYLPWKR